MQFDKQWCFEVHTLCWRAANVIARPVRQKPRYATDHGNKIWSILETWSVREITSNASQQPFPTRKLHICRKQFVIQQTVPYSCLHLPVSLHRARTRARQQTSIHPSSRHVFHRIHMRNPILRQGTRAFVGVRWGVKVKKLCHAIWWPHRSRYVQSCTCPLSSWRVTPVIHMWSGLQAE